jgi:hypothetical protein
LKFVFFKEKAPPPPANRSATVGASFFLPTFGAPVHAEIRDGKSTIPTLAQNPRQAWQAEKLYYWRNQAALRLDSTG